ncbi:5-hydroxymethyl-dUMP N-hydrolase isoform X2 [Callithrix jacchus]
MAAAGARGIGEHGELGEPGRPALYFCGSIRGGREDRALYERIVTRLRRFGTVLTEHVAAAELGQRGEEAAGDDRLIHEQDLAWLQQADRVVAEVTQPSLGVGYELGRAVALNKRILCLFRPQSGRDRVSLCHPRWSTVAQSRLTTAMAHRSLDLPDSRHPPTSAS